MKIVISLGSLQCGGTARVVSALGNYLIREHQIFIITTYQDKPAFRLDERISVLFLKNRCAERQRKLESAIKELRNILQTIDQIQPDIILAMGPEMSFRMLAVKYFRKIPTIISARANPERELSSHLYKCLASILYKKADGMVCQTAATQEYYSSKLSKKVVIIPNPIEEEFLTYPIEKEKEKVIVAVGRLVQDKNYPLLLNVFSKISKNYPEYHLLIAGEGEERENLKQISKNLRIQNKVSFLGNVSDIKPLYAKCSVYVLCSNNEGMPNSLMEAMALGAPTIATDCPVGGPRYLIENKKNGLLIQMSNEKELGEAIQRILNDPGLAFCMGKQAKEDSQKFSVKRTGKQWEQYLLKYGENKE